MPVKRHKAANIRCQATNQSGEPCAAPRTRDSDYCSLHLVPGRAAELGKRGGQTNRFAPDHDSGEPIAIPETAGDVFRFLAEATALTRAGRMSSKLGTTLSYMCMALLRALEATDFERRLRELEELSRRVSADEVGHTPAHLLPEFTPEEYDRFVEADLGGTSTG